MKNFTNNILDIINFRDSFNLSDYNRYYIKLLLWDDSGEDELVKQCLKYAKNFKDTIQKLNIDKYYYTMRYDLRNEQKVGKIDFYNYYILKVATDWIVGLVENLGYKIKKADYIPIFYNEQIINTLYIEI